MRLPRLLLVLTGLYVTVVALFAAVCAALLRVCAVFLLTDGWRLQLPLLFAGGGALCSFFFLRRAVPRRLPGGLAVVFFIGAFLSMTYLFRVLVARCAPSVPLDAAAAAPLRPAFHYTADTLLIDTAFTGRAKQYGETRRRNGTSSERYYDVYTVYSLPGRRDVWFGTKRRDYIMPPDDTRPRFPELISADGRAPHVFRRRYGHEGVRRFRRVTGSADRSMYLSAIAAACAGRAASPQPDSVVIIEAAPPVETLPEILAILAMIGCGVITLSGCLVLSCGKQV